MIFVSGIGVALLIVLLLLGKKNKSRADRILTAWMVVVLAHLSFYYIYVTNELSAVPFLLGIEQPLPLIHGVFLYLYVGSVTGQLPKRKVFLILHFIPALLVYLYLIPYFLLLPAEKVLVYQNAGQAYPVYSVLRMYAIELSGCLYVSWSAVLLKRHRRAIEDCFSDLHRVNLQWLNVLTIGLGIIWLSVIFVRDERITWSGIVIFIFIIGFFGVRQINIFSNRTPLVNEPEGKRKYEKSGLNAETAGMLYSSLLLLMKEESLHRKSELSIGDLATRLDVHPNYLSQVINEKTGKNFYEFVNNYRIEEFKKLVSDPKNRRLTLLSIAFDCGFNSKSSFNRFFKKTTGKTPSEYFNEISGDVSPTS